MNNLVKNPFSISFYFFYTKFSLLEDWQIGYGYAVYVKNCCSYGFFLLTVYSFVFPLCAIDSTLNDDKSVELILQQAWKWKKEKEKKVWWNFHVWSICFLIVWLGLFISLVEIKISLFNSILFQVYLKKKWEKWLTTIHSEFLPIGKFKKFFSILKSLYKCSASNKLLMFLALHYCVNSIKKNSFYSNVIHW